MNIFVDKFQSKNRNGEIHNVTCIARALPAEVMGSETATDQGEVV